VTKNANFEAAIQDQEIEAPSVPDVSSTPKPETIEGPSVLDNLLAAKAESDRGNYGAKHRILQKVIQDNFDDFVVDSEDAYVYGITHVPTGFRIHIPKNKMPNMAKAAADWYNPLSWFGDSAPKPPQDRTYAKPNPTITSKNPDEAWLGEAGRESRTSSFNNVPKRPPRPKELRPNQGIMYRDNLRRASDLATTTGEDPTRWYNPLTWFKDAPRQVDTNQLGMFDPREGINTRLGYPISDEDWNTAVAEGQAAMEQLPTTSQWHMQRRVGDIRNPSFFEPIPVVYPDPHPARSALATKDLSIWERGYAPPLLGNAGSGIRAHSGVRPGASAYVSPSENRPLIYASNYPSIKTLEHEAAHLNQYGWDEEGGYTEDQPWPDHLMEQWAEFRPQKNRLLEGLTTYDPVSNPDGRKFTDGLRPGELSEWLRRKELTPGEYEDEHDRSKSHHNLWLDYQNLTEEEKRFLDHALTKNDQQSGGSKNAGIKVDKYLRSVGRIL